MWGPDGTVYPMSGVYREIIEPERTVFSSSALDPQGKPLFEVLTTVTFAEHGGKTTLTLHARVVRATAEAAPHLKGMNEGWPQTLDRLGKYVTTAPRCQRDKRRIQMNQGNSPAALVGDREIAATRVFEAPRELVFKMWTDPHHLANWWGPRGFRTTTFHMDLKPGGVWRFVMHGPDGVDYQNKITFIEVVEGERLVYQHGGDEDVEPVNFQVTVTFAEHAGKTRLTMRMVFPSGAARDHIVKTYGADQGLTQTLERLNEHLARSHSDDLPFVISRVFDAPRQLVWKAWTERDRLMQWFGPKGFTMRVATLDFRPGGIFHYCLRSPDGRDMWGKFVYREIIVPQRIVLVNSFSDDKGNLTRHPMSPTWPREMLSTTTFAEYQGKTTITLAWTALNPTEEERKTFNTGRDGMRMGWTGTFDQLAQYLAIA